MANAPERLKLPSRAGGIKEFEQKPLDGYQPEAACENTQRHLLRVVRQRQEQRRDR